jgi:hypothetical protein
MDCVENTISNSSLIVARELVAMGTYLFRGRYLVTGLHATIYKVTSIYSEYMVYLNMLSFKQSKMSRLHSCKGLERKAYKLLWRTALNSYLWKKKLGVSAHDSYNTQNMIKNQS